MNWNTDQMQSAVAGSVIPVVGSGSLVPTYIPTLPALTVAFATGACGSENWGGVPGASWAAENVPQLSAAHLNYVVSTGGEAGTFTCASTSGMDSFIARYASPNLVGIDFDIEGGQTTPCPSAQTYASPTCNSVTGTTALQYTNRFLNDGAGRRSRGGPCTATAGSGGPSRPARGCSSTTSRSGSTATRSAIPPTATPRSARCLRPQPR